NRLIRCVCGKKIGPDPRNFNQRVSLGRNDLLIRTFPKAAKGDAKTKEEVPEDVIKYMRDNGILIDGMTIDDYMAKYGDHGKLDKGGLQAIKAALDNDANRNTDLMSQGQITIQKMSQELNAVLTQLTGLISKWGEISSMIAQKTYS
ncbi:hypothetical protein QR004_23170, partial [Salmonella enterica]|nr:hypothetical protein [Salmonella enterica]